MRIKIPEGKFCGNCQFNKLNSYACGLFQEENKKFDKIPDCINEFGNGGEFELVKVGEKEAKE